MPSSDAGVAGALTNAMRQIGDAGDDALIDGYVAAFVVGAGLLAFAAVVAVVMTGSRRAFAVIYCHK